MDISEFTYYDCLRSPKVMIAKGDAPEGWWGGGSRIKKYQSWERPFLLETHITRNQDGSGGMIAVDTGEAFSWFYRSTIKMPQDPFADLGEGILSAFAGIPMMTHPLPQIAVPTPRNGRPEKQFDSVSAYLDEKAMEIATPKYGSQVPMPRVECLGERIVGDTEVDTIARERRQAVDAARSWAEAGIAGLSIRLNSVLNRTVVRIYRLTYPNGDRTRLVIGATMTGHDILCYEGNPPYDIQPNSWAFGHADVTGVSYYEVDWMASPMFAGIVPEGGGIDVAEFEEAVIRAGLTTEFSDALMQEMSREERRLSNLGHEEHQREIERLHELNRQLEEQSRQEDIARAERERQRQAQRRQDEERRRAWDRKADSDRRLREMWSATNRGVDQYADPYGRLVEVPSGLNKRAFWDRSTGQVVTSDISDMNKPSDWEELRPWQW